jgi:hypothetical protein
MPTLAEWVIYGSFLIAVVGMIYRAVRVRKRLKYWLGPVNWDFSVSWASTFTVIGAFLGTVLGQSGVIPENTHYLPNAAYGGLNLLFGLITLLAPLLYAATRTVDAPETRTDVKQPQYHGFVWAFLLSSGLTFWAVLGQLATVGLLLAEIQKGGAVPKSVLIVLVLLGLISLGLVWVHVLKGTHWVVAYQSEDPSSQKRTDARTYQEDTSRRVEPALPSWSVF